MNDTRRGLDAPAIGLMLVLCLIWGFQQIAIKAVAADISPTLQIGLRSGVAALLVALYMAFRRERLTVGGGMWKYGSLVALLFALEFVFVGLGLAYTSAAHMVVFLYSAPIFAALGLHWKLPSERLTAPQWLGVFTAFAGIAVAFLWHGDAPEGAPASSSLFGDFLALLAAMAWGATTVVIRVTPLASLPATQTLLYQLIGAFVVLVPTAFLLGQAHFNPTPLALASLAFQTVFISFMSLLAWFALLRRYLASRLGVFSFMTPLFGVLMGAWLLNEPIEPGFLIGAIWVLVGITQVTSYAWIARWLSRKK